MELLLNFCWVVLAACMLWLWLRMAPPAGSDRRMQFVALALVVFILLPAISMTDDLAAAKNPAEVDVCASLRRDHGWQAPHAIVPATVALIVPFFAGLLFHSAPVLTAFAVPAAALRAPALDPVENRPPPTA